MDTIAQTQGAIQFDIAAGDLGRALQAFGLTVGMTVITSSELTAGKQSRALRGRYDSEAGLARLLRGTGLMAKRINGGFVVKSVPVLATVPDDQSLVVTGSHIRGATPASPVITLSQTDMRNAGHSNLGDAVRAIPQSFGGGQNPGVGQGVTAESSVNVSSGSSINLRGLGPDATLTLLNGKRLTYNAQAQSVDISAIPFGAVDRIEVVADGASALYGSDAVGGVANIILKRDFDGLLTSARWGASTDGGNKQQQYSATGGKRWAGGGLILAYDYSHTTPILAGQRSYTTAPYRTNYLVPGINQHSLLASGHQSITPDISFNFDGLFSKRRAALRYGLSTLDYRGNGYDYGSRSTSFMLAPSVEFRLPGQWRATLVGTYGEDRTRYGTDIYQADRIVAQSYGCYCNQSKSIEANAEGALFALPAGAVRLAIGTGYRANTLKAFRTIGAAQHIANSVESYYGYGELFVPLVAPGQGIDFIHRLEWTGAVRYENYPGLDSVATPKFGLVYAPGPDLDIKASWGKSFKAPTLYQRYANRTTNIFPTTALGSSAYPAGSTALLRTGGNPDLTAERATSWSATLALHPRAIDGLTLDLSYFQTRYRDRIVQPLSFRARALADPIYADLINYNPSDADKVAALDADTVFNNLPIPYNPSSVVAIFDARYLNVAGQVLKGVDLSGRYAFDLGPNSAMTAGASASYLQSRQQLSPNRAYNAVAGTLFNPPHWRARGYLTVSDGGFTGSANLSYIGGVSDQRTTPALSVGSMTMLDLTARYAVSSGPLSGTEFTLTLQNALNDKPSVINTSLAYLTPYDSTNYSAVGRFISFAIAKRW